MNRNEFYIIPENFKKGKYLFNRYRTIDICILSCCSLLGLFIIISFIFLASELKIITLGVISTTIGLLIISIGILLTANVPYYHNLLGKIICILKFTSKRKKYVWKGVDYKEYEEK